MRPSNINTGICHRRVQEGLPAFFVNWTDGNGENQYAFSAIRSVVVGIEKRLRKEAGDE
jgi:hypothetical protein